MLSNIIGLEMRATACSAILAPDERVIWSLPERKASPGLDADVMFAAVRRTRRGLGGKLERASYSVADARSIR
jgi:hypothetical protein